MSRLSPKIDAARKILNSFVDIAKPLEINESIHLLIDERTGDFYCECHVMGSSLERYGSIDVPLDPDEQAEYRANREIVRNHTAFLEMQRDAKQRRSFSNIVAEFLPEDAENLPLKIIGGQHRFEAIRDAVTESVDVYFGVKVHVMLTKEQRLDVQLISNTNIAVSADLLDRMRETYRGPELRDWCQEVGFLGQGQDFADNRVRSSALSVHLVTSFVVN
jgi:hypothetical protein